MSECLFSVVLPRRMRKRDRVPLLEELEEKTGLSMKEIMCKNQKFLILDAGIDIDPDFLTGQIQSFIDWYENE